MNKTDDPQNNGITWFTNIQRWMLVIGAAAWIVAFFLSYVNQDNAEWLKIAKEILTSIGGAIIAGVVIGSIMSHRQMQKFYMNEIGEVIFGEKFLGSRTDIENVWDRATRAFFTHKFSAINDELLCVMKDIYFTKEDSVYYQNYTHTYRVEWADEEHKYIKVEEHCSFDLITANDKSTPFSQKHWLAIKKGDDPQNYSMSTSIFIDGELKKEVVGEIDGDHMIAEWSCTLNGKSKYHVKKEGVRRYNFEVDHFFGFRAKYITNGMHVAVVHPKDMMVVCAERGTQNDYEKEVFTDESCEFRYNGLILPRQGYVIIMSKKQSL